jgi:two-component system, chemotaxis family, CheB/CheR fusion protein
VSTRPVSSLPNEARLDQTAYEHVPSTRNGRGATVFVVDDDRAIRELMLDVLLPIGYAVELFADGSTFIDSYRPGFYECLLVDAVMPAMSGIELIEHLNDKGHTIPAVVLTGHADVPMAVQAMKAGAVDFIEKPVGRDELLASIRMALNSVQNATQVRIAANAARCVARLTARQRRVLELVLAGHASKTIAASLGISQRTVDNHRAAIMKKTGSKSIPALVRTALASPEQPRRLATRKPAVVVGDAED